MTPGPGAWRTYPQECPEGEHEEQERRPEGDGHARARHLHVAQQLQRQGPRPHRQQDVRVGRARSGSPGHAPHARFVSRQNQGSPR